METLTTQTIKRIALFSSFFSGDEVPYYVKHYLMRLKQHTTYIVYITTDDKHMDVEGQDGLLGLVDKVIQVKNDGFDFGMWQKALQIVRVEGFFDELILANDSCVCFGSFEAYFAWHEQQINSDVTGITLSYDRCKHLQSFFMVIKKPALTESIQFLKNLTLSNAVHSEVITHGELAFSTHMIDHGFKLSGFYTPKQDDFSNPMYFMCCDLIKMGVPLIKRKLLREWNVGVMRNIQTHTGDYSYNSLIAMAQQKHQLDDKTTKELFGTIVLQKPPIGLKFKLKRRIFKRNLKRIIATLFN